MDAKYTRRGSRSDGSDGELSREKSSHRRERDAPRSPRDREDRKRRTRSREDSRERSKKSRSDRDRSRERHSHHRKKDDDDSDRHRGSHHRRERRDRSADDSQDERRSARRERSHRHRSRSRDDKDRSHRRHRSRSPPTKKRRSRSRSASKSSPKPPAVQRSRAPLPSQNDSFRGEVAPGEAPPPEKQKPNFKPTGLLAKEANTVAGTTTVLKYNEPPEARKPSSKEQWRMYVFKGKDLIDTVYLYQRSVWLMGRDQRVTDLPLEHPSISKQHAVIQFRYVTSTNEFGDRTSKVKPYLIDLESTKGTKLNGEKVAPSRFVELRDQDVIGFGDSEREYVMMLPEVGK